MSTVAVDEAATAGALPCTPPTAVCVGVFDAEGMVGAEKATSLDFSGCVCSEALMSLDWTTCADGICGSINGRDCNPLTGNGGCTALGGGIWAVPDGIVEAAGAGKVN